MNLLNLRSKFWSAERMVFGGYDFVEPIDLSTFTKTQIAAGDASIQVSPNGILRATGAATTDNSGAQIQIASAPVKLKAKSVAEFEVRQSISSTLVEWLLGFSIVDASLIASFPNDAVYLYKPENSASVSLVVRHGGVAYTRAAIAQDAADGFHRWGIQIRCDAVDGKTAQIVVFKDGVQVYAADGANFDMFTDMPNDVNLTPSYAMQSGSAAGTQYVDLDYLKYGASRF